MNTQWNANHYLRFEKERTQPSIDLVNRIEADNPKTIIDMGCGPGNSTQILRNKWKNARIIGLDNSKQMIEKARETYPDQEWILQNILDFHQKKSFDILFSNAVLQWIPHHGKLLPNLLSLLKPQGILAVQVPQNQHSPFHSALIKTAQEKDFEENTRQARNILNYQSAKYYYDLLQDKLQSLVIWETTYIHVLDSPKDLLDWYTSTGLRPYLENLPNEEVKRKFLDRILQICEKEYLPQSNGKILFPFNRLFILGKL